MLFLSTFVNKIDKKGRVSVPSSFRALLNQDFSGVIVYESISNKCIEACSLERIKKLSDGIDELDPYSDERDAFSSIILGGSVKLSFDSEGRVMLPENLIKFANLTDRACFVGKGKTFEIWDPKKYDEHYTQAKEFARKNKALLRINKGNNG
ncbi:MAG: cell division/cell wall cluster transcriptional repressor MraZ [Alphaproteobacteria bacterium]|nr:cell division/cell wall cluster transcriptional repressor MraZ [Alphaproteobacteria bacterium]